MTHEQFLFLTRSNTSNFIKFHILLTNGKKTNMAEDMISLPNPAPIPADKTQAVVSCAIQRKQCVTYIKNAAHNVKMNYIPEK